MTTRKPVVPVPLNMAADIRRIINGAPSHGADAVEALNRYELILTPLQRNRIEVEVLRKLADELQRWQPHEMLRRKFHVDGSRTPADMYHVIQEFLDEFIQKRKDNPL